RLFRLRSLTSTLPGILTLYHLVATTAAKVGDVYAQRVMAATSRAVEYPWSSRPLGLAKRVSVRPMATARWVIRASKERTESDTCSANTTATSCDECSISA